MATGTRTAQNNSEQKRGARTSGATKGASEDIAAQVEALREDLAGLTEAVGKYAAAQGERATGIVSNGAQQAHDFGRAQASHLSAQAQEYHDQVEDFVSRRPELAIGMAAGFGLILGLLIARR